MSIDWPAIRQWPGSFDDVHRAEVLALFDTKGPPFAGTQESDDVSRVIERVAPAALAEIARLDGIAASDLWRARLLATYPRWAGRLDHFGERAERFITLARAAEARDGAIWGFYQRTGALE